VPLYNAAYIPSRLLFLKDRKLATSILIFLRAAEFILLEACQQVNSQSRLAGKMLRSSAVTFDFSWLHHHSSRSSSIQFSSLVRKMQGELPHLTNSSDPLRESSHLLSLSDKIQIHLYYIVKKSLLQVHRSFFRRQYKAYFSPFRLDKVTIIDALCPTFPYQSHWCKQSYALMKNSHNLSWMSTKHSESVRISTEAILMVYSLKCSSAEKDAQVNPVTLRSSCPQLLSGRLSSHQGIVHLVVYQ